MCGNPGSFVTWDTGETTNPDDETEFKCSQCSVDYANIRNKRPWLAKLIETVVRKKRARLVLQELLDE